jgi:hypothetical protein
MTNSTTVNVVGTLANGQTGIWNSTTNQFEPGSGGGGPGSRRTPIDSNTVICWPFDETAAPFSNTGTAGALDLTVTGTSTSAHLTGIFDHCVSFNGNPGGLSTPIGGTSVGEPSDPTSFTILLWTFINNYATNGIFFNKHRTANPGNGGGSTNQYAYSIQLQGPADGSWAFYWTPAGTTTMVAAGAGGVNHGGNIPLRQWCLLAVTISGSTVNMYLNGSLVGTLTQAPAGVNFGTHGRYSVGYLADPNLTPIDAQIDDIRVINGVLSEATLFTMYGKGINLP